MKKVGLRDVILSLFVIIGVLLIVDVLDFINIFNLNDRFHPMAVMVVWAISMQIVMFLFSPRIDD